MTIHEGALINGQELYSLYRAKLAMQGVDTDLWEDLEDGDKIAWELLSEDLLLWTEST